MVQAAAAAETNAPPNGLKALTGERILGSPLQEICTMGSERGDEHKRPRSLGEGTGTKVPDDSEAPQRATASRPVPTHQADLPPEQYAYRAGRNA